MKKKIIKWYIKSKLFILEYILSWKRIQINYYTTNVKLQIQMRKTQKATQYIYII